MNRVLLHPFVTEKTMNNMTGTPTQNFTDGNKLEFIVQRDADKHEIKEAFEELFEAEVVKVWTKITKHGKHAIIQLDEAYSAEEIGMRIGVF